MIWRSGPKITKLALDAIAVGAIAWSGRHEPPDVAAHLDRLGVPR